MTEIWNLFSSALFQWLEHVYHIVKCANFSYQLLWVENIFLLVNKKKIGDFYTEVLFVYCSRNNMKYYLLDFIKISLI